MAGDGRDDGRGGGTRDGTPDDVAEAPVTGDRDEQRAAAGSMPGQGVQSAMHADPGDDVVRVYVEVPKGSRNKYEYDRQSGQLVLDRRLYAAVSYPADYGFITRTVGEDGDELDAMVLVTEPTFPGCVVLGRPVAMLRMDDGEEPNDKVVCAPLADPAWDWITDLDDMPTDVKAEIEHFFKVYTDLGGKEFRVHGWASREDTLAEVQRSRQRFEEREDGT